MREIAIKSIIAFLLLAARVASAQGTTTFLSNIGQPSSGSLAVGSDSWIAAPFQTGTNVSGYILDSIQLGMASSTGTPSGFTVMLYANLSTAGIYPGSSLATFMGPFDPSTSGTYTYIAPAGLILSARGTYFIVVTAGTPEATGAYQWSDVSTSAFNPTGGWVGIDGLWSSSNGSSWPLPVPSGYFQFAINASVAPEPGVMGLLAVGGVVLLGATVRGLKSKVRG